MNALAGLMTGSKKPATAGGGKAGGGFAAKKTDRHQGSESLPPRGSAVTEPGILIGR